MILSKALPMSVLRNGLLLAGISALLAGCSPGTKELEAWVAEVKARTAPPLEPLPVMKQFENFEYAAQALRDPFSAPVPDRDVGNGKGPDPNRRKEALEAYPLDSLSMVGTIGSGGGLVALLMAPDKVTYRVTTGNYVGQNDGRISGVSADHIDIVELVPDGAGGWLERQAKVALDEK